MRRRLFVAGMLVVVVLVTSFMVFGLAAARRAGGQKQRVGRKQPQALSVRVVPWGPSQEEIDAVVAHLPEQAAMQKNLDGTRYRMISFELLDPDIKTGPQVPPSQYRATFYDYTNNRTITATGSFAKADELSVEEVDYQPLPSPDEFAAAVEVLQHDATFGAALRAGRLKIYEPMPPLIFSERGEDGRIERTITVGLRATNPDDPEVERANEVVAVNMTQEKVLRFKDGAPDTSAAAAPTACTPPPSGGSSTGRGLAGQYQFTITQGATELWSFLAIRPSASSGADGSGVELRDVKYKGKTVLKRGHVPILNILYDGNTCGPFRDWQYAENQFEADPTNGTNVASGVRACTIPALTELETNNDAGNHQGIAYYNEGDAVVLVSEMSAGWYRYISEWRFRQDGTIQPRFGMGAVQNGCTCQGHVHHVYWRFDFDVNGTDNAVFEARRPGSFDTPLATEIKRNRASKGYLAWLVQNPGRGDAYMIKPGDNDGLATDDTTGYARGDFWLLRYRSTELDDSAVRTNTQANLDAFVNNETTGDKDIVIWYGAHVNHNRGMYNRMHPHSISGPLVAGPDLVPVRW